MTDHYVVIWDAEAVKDLKLLPRNIAKRIVHKVDTYLVQHPQSLGKPLQGSLKGLYRYRIGEYRVIYEVRSQELVVVVVKVGIRRDVYEK